MLGGMTDGNWLEQGVKAHDQGDFAGAVAAYRQFLSLTPGNVDVLTLLGNALQQSGDYPGAIAVYADALALQPENAVLQNNTGVALRQQGYLDDALDCFLNAINLAPSYVDAWLNIGSVLNIQGRLEHAATAFNRVLDLEPQNPKVHVGLGNTLSRAGLYDAALTSYETALLLEPSNMDARWGRGLVNLSLGQWDTAWQDYELRFRVQAAYPFAYNKPRWRGEGFADKTVLIHDEIGYGDVFQFSRYFPRVKQRGGRVVLEVKPGLKRLFDGFPGVDEVRERGSQPQPEADFDLVVPLESLPGIFATRTSSIPPVVGPVLSDTLLATWQDRLSSMPGRKVGIVWAGNPNSAYDAERSMQLNDLLPLLRAARDCSFVSLQVGAAKEQLQASDVTIFDASPWLADFAETAAAISSLDLVICVETSVTHLAGMLGKPTWVLLAKVPAWRWGVAADNTPWYPNMHLYRQAEAGNWGNVLDAVAKDLGAI